MTKKQWLYVALIAIAAALIVWGITQTAANFGKDPARVLPRPSLPASTAAPTSGTP